MKIKVIVDDNEFEVEQGIVHTFQHEGLIYYVLFVSERDAIIDIACKQIAELKLPRRDPNNKVR